MTIARSRQICLEQTTWYHCTSRCVRQAFICGVDFLTKRDYSHRKQWIEDRIHFLTQSFCIDVAAYAIMSNHYHIVVKVDTKSAEALNDLEVAKRWHTIFAGNKLAKSYLNGDELDEAQIQALKPTIQNWRSELTNISRFMGLINQFIAKKSNEEDDRTGKFWEARFRSQAILDDDALLRTIAYVELNPVRAKIAETPEKSEFTSIHRRLNRSHSGLLPFQLKQTVGDTTANSGACIPISFDDYLSLLDWTGRQIRSDKRGFISQDIPPIFERLQYSPEQWVKSQRSNTKWQQAALGSIERIDEFCRSLGRCWIWQSNDHKITT